MAEDHETYQDIREAVAKLCARFPGEYWRKLDREMAYPQAFVDALTEAGWLSVLIPEEYGGAGLPLSAAAAVLEEMQRAGCNGGACHAQMYTMGTLLRHGSAEQKAEYLPRIASGELRLQAFGVTEPTSGTDTGALKTTARREGDEFVINGQKIWTTMANDANWCFLLVRTDGSGKKQNGISFLLVPMDAPGVTVRPILNLEMHDEFCEVFFDNVRVPKDNLVGEINQGWTMAKALLGFERIFLGSPRQAAYAFARLEELGAHLGLTEDPVFRDACARFSLDLENHKALFASFLRAISRGRPVGAEISLLKISQSELFRRITDYMMEIGGPEAGRIDALDAAGTLNPSAQFLQARPATIYGGSSEIQRNIIAKAVLGLPS